MGRFCTNCGSEIKEGSNFCGTCGVRARSAADMIEGKREISNKPGKSRRMKLFILLIILSLIGVTSYAIIRVKGNPIDEDILSWKRATTYNGEGKITGTKTAERIGNEVHVRIYDSDGKEIEKEEYKFEKGLLTEIVYYNLEENRYVEGSKEKMTYDVDGKILKKEYCYTNMYESDEYQYNSEGYLTKVICHYDDGDEKGSFALNCIDDGKEMEWASDEGTWYRYIKDEEGHYLEKQIFDLSSGEVLCGLKWEFNEKGKIVKEVDYGDGGDYNEYTEFEY